MKADDEIIRTWSPVAGISDRLYCMSVSDGSSGLRIVLGGPEHGRKRMQILFENPIAYRNIEETYRNRTWLRIHGAAPNLAIIENSEWASWLDQESGGLISETRSPLLHYAIYTDQDCIDVATYLEPIVEVLG